ncbi:hypothetical protein I8J29_16375 [Paenibacillus sp. MWE-103]|uniref:Uncharacterized protein n=1 Tax=Paenibacillus artemisiicola TaxID=1172618 RepID=A0ABS3WBV0_9BACL|nr:hypothetical protein [Paenibacillus artemisiicola]MBO7745785.1 hypothetical protein [Paenibacillus artemisiicola]
MLLEASETFIYTVLLILIAIPVSSVFVSLYAHLQGRYLNRYFIIQPRKNGGYELHHQPLLGFYYARERKFHRMIVEAIRIFQMNNPDCMLVANTLTFVSRSRGSMLVQTPRSLLTFLRFMADFLVLLNLANYRRVKRQWQIVQLIRNVHQSRPVYYVVVAEQPGELYNWSN